MQKRPDSPPTTESVAPRAGRVVIIGRPNVGKSTLLNAILGTKLAITTNKPGTTRSVLLGVYDGKNDDGERTQIAFLDTPGLERPRSVLGRVLVEEAQGALEGVDAIVFLVAAGDVLRKNELTPEDRHVEELAKAAGVPIVLVLNKVDRVRDKRALLPLLEQLGTSGGYHAVVPMSGLRGTNVDGLVRELRGLFREGLAYEDDTLTDRPERFFAAELVREAIFEATRDEIPYSTAVVVDEWVDEGTLARIAVTIVVERDGHKGIVIGARGTKLKEIGEQARIALEAFLERKVFLKTFVKVVPEWTKSTESVRRLLRDGGAS